MTDLLCEFAKRFPILAAQILHRDCNKSRNFREETITDVLMAGLVGFEPFGIYVDFPADESKTGEDMDWEFVDPNASDGRCYLRLHIQAKRAIESKGKAKPTYWFYRELDHAVPKGAPKGSQHSLLITQAGKTPGCVPLYIFYHPNGALAPAIPGLPAIEGVNLIFADQIPVKKTIGHWPILDKKVATWRPQFMPLSRFLCFGHETLTIQHRSPGPPFFFTMGERGAVPSPGAIADRLNELRGIDVYGQAAAPVEAIREIPPQTQRAMDYRHRVSAASDGRRFEIDRPRILFDASPRETDG
jgi:hypothetical protein